MPKSLPRRVERLERGDGGPPAARPDALGLLSLVERLGRTPEAPRPAGFDAAWAAYVAARDAAGPEWADPPAGYRPQTAGPERVRLWRRWDGPPVARAVDRLLELLVVWGKPPPPPPSPESERRAL